MPDREAPILQFGDVTAKKVSSCLRNPLSPTVPGDHARHQRTELARPHLQFGRRRVVRRQVEHGRRRRRTSRRGRCAAATPSAWPNCRSARWKRSTARRGLAGCAPQIFPSESGRNRSSSRSRDPVSVALLVREIEVVNAARRVILAVAAGRDQERHLGADRFAAQVECRRQCAVPVRRTIAPERPAVPKPRRRLPNGRR